MAWLAALPILVAFGMLALRQSTVRTGVVALLVALVLAAAVFHPATAGLADSGLRFGARVLEVLGILLGGIWLSRVLADTGAQRLLSAWVERHANGQYAGAVLTVFAITPLAESLTGFGIGVVLAIPILRHLGFDPVRAAVLALLGLNSVTWGGLAPGAAVAASLGDVPLQDLGVRSAQLNIVVLLIVAVVVVRTTAATGVPLVRRSTEAVGAALLLWAAVLLANLLLGTPLAGVVGGLVATLVQLGVRRLASRPALDGRRPDGIPDDEPAGDAGLTLTRAATPYGVLLLLLVALRLGIGAFAGAEPGAVLVVLESPATCLLLTCVVAHLLLRDRIAAHTAVFRVALSQWYVVAAATGMFMILGWLYTVTGMAREIGLAVSGLGAGFLLLSPLLGALGGFVTGSATGSNAMLSATQAQGAVGVGASVLTVLSAQNVAGCAATMTNLPRLELSGALSSGDAVRPAPTGPMLRTLLGVPLASALVLGVLNLLLA